MKIMNYLSLAMLLTSMSTISYSRHEGTIGNGGDVVKCTEGGEEVYYLLDYYEAKFNSGQKVELDLGPEGSNYKQKVSYVLNKLKKVSPIRAARLEKEVNFFYEELENGDSYKLGNVTDTYERGVLSNCELPVQIVKQFSKKEIEDELNDKPPVYMINKELFEKVLNSKDGDIQVAGLILHEALYRDGLNNYKLKGGDSRPVRRMNRLISSHKFFTYSDSELKDKFNNNNFLVPSSFNHGMFWDGRYKASLLNFNNKCLSKNISIGHGKKNTVFKFNFDIELDGQVIEMFNRHWLSRYGYYYNDEGLGVSKETGEIFLRGYKFANGTKSYVLNPNIKTNGEDSYIYQIDNSKVSATLYLDYGNENVFRENCSIKYAFINELKRYTVDGKKRKEGTSVIKFGKRKYRVLTGSQVLFHPNGLPAIFKVKKIGQKKWVYLDKNGNLKGFFKNKEEILKSNFNFTHDFYSENPFRFDNWKERESILYKESRFIYGVEE